MPHGHSADDLIDFLAHAEERGLMPAATAQALGVATRNVLSVLDDEERANLPLDDMDAIIRRFKNKRARDVNPASLKEYGRRVKRAAELYRAWREDPANFTVKTRATNARRNPERRVGASSKQAEPLLESALQEASGDVPAMAEHTGYQTAVPVRPGHVVTISNIPHDLSAAEAERLAQFIRLLALA